jgi:hypothetical protein
METSEWVVVRDRCAETEQALSWNDCYSRGGCKIVAQRYCTNCGAELREEDRFCPSCGRRVHETAALSTPEADVSVPPAPQAGEEHRPRISLGQFVVGFLVLLGVLWLLIPTEGGSGGGGGNGGGGDAVDKVKQKDQKVAQQEKPQPSNGARSKLRTKSNNPDNKVALRKSRSHKKLP